MRYFLSLGIIALTLTGRGALGYPRGVQRSKILSSADDVDAVYDYVIVGGGTAGLTVADRLSEDGETSVLVIEHGVISDSPSINRVQGAAGGLNPQFLYSINSVPQENLRNRTVAVLVGDLVGGSSAVNGMMTVRGTTEDYNRWGSFFSNNSEWSWEGLMPYFQKALKFAPPGAEVTESANITYNTKFWGNTSGVYAGWPSYQYPGTPVLFNAYREVPGVKFPEDSGAGETGVYWFPTFMDPNTVNRSYSLTGHYENLNRSNYHLVTSSKVNRITFNGTTATGVTFVPVVGRTGSTNVTTAVKMVGARKEVILAAGAIHSPQILQLSGIGPKALLGQANITTVVDLPGVGQNFQDHPMLSISISYRNFTVHPSAVDLTNNATFRAWAEEVWTENRTGPNSIAAGNAAAWLPFPVISSRSEEIASNLSAQDHAAQLAPETDPTVVAGYEAQMESYAAALRSDKTAFFGSVIIPGRGSGNLIDLHPLSRGTVNIDITDPEGKEPVVDYRALSNPLDTAVLADLIRFARRYYFNNTVNAQFDPREMRPGESLTSDSDLAGYITTTLSPSEFHPVGTCAMMPRDMGGVVNEKLKVYGVDRLRVVDGSMMPTLPGANTCQTVYAVAEKAADLIKMDAKSVTRQRVVRRDMHQHYQLPNRAE